MVGETTTAIAPPRQLPVWLTVKETYWHLWRHRWVYLCQLFVWSVFALLIQIPLNLPWTLLYRLGTDWFNTLAPLLNLTEVTLPLLAGGGLMFLACGRAILNDRAPRIGDAVRVVKLGTFWRYLAACWLVVSLVPEIGNFWLRPYMYRADFDPTWFGYYTWLAIRWTWALATVPLVILALPVAAFEGSTTAVREGWKRSRGSRIRLALLALAAATPAVALQILLSRGVPTLWIQLLSEPSPLFRWPLNLFWEPIVGIAPFLTILVLGAAVTCAYARLSPRFEHVARVFD